MRYETKYIRTNIKDNALIGSSTKLAMCQLASWHAINWYRLAKRALTSVKDDNAQMFSAPHRKGSNSYDLCRSFSEGASCAMAVKDFAQLE